jgi:hypothetical protein
MKKNLLPFLWDIGFKLGCPPDRGTGRDFLNALLLSKPGKFLHLVPGKWGSNRYGS